MTSSLRHPGRLVGQAVKGTTRHSATCAARFAGQAPATCVGRGINPSGSSGWPPGNRRARLCWTHLHARPSLGPRTAAFPAPALATLAQILVSRCSRSCGGLSVLHGVVHRGCIRLEFLSWWPGRIVVHTFAADHELPEAELERLTTRFRDRLGCRTCNPPRPRRPPPSRGRSSTCYRAAGSTRRIRSGPWSRCFGPPSRSRVRGARCARDRRWAQRKRRERSRRPPSRQGRRRSHRLGHDLGRSDASSRRSCRGVDPPPHACLSLPVGRLAAVLPPAESLPRLRAGRGAGARAALRRSAAPVPRGRRRGPEEPRPAPPTRIPAGEARAVPGRSRYLPSDPSDRRSGDGRRRPRRRAGRGAQARQAVRAAGTQTGRARNPLPPCRAAGRRPAGPPVGQVGPEHRHRARQGARPASATPRTGTQAPVRGGALVAGGGSEGRGDLRRRAKLPAEPLGVPLGARQARGRRGAGDTRGARAAAPAGLAARARRPGVTSPERPIRRTSLTRSSVEVSRLVVEARLRWVANGHRCGADGSGTSTSARRRSSWTGSREETRSTAGRSTTTPPASTRSRSWPPSIRPPRSRRGNSRPSPCGGWKQPSRRPTALTSRAGVTGW